MFLGDAMTVQGNGLPKRFVSCRFLREFVFIGDGTIQHCCKPGRGFPAIDEPLGKTFPYEKVRESRRRIEEALNSGRDCPCSGCPYLEEKEWNEPGYFCSNIAIAEGKNCNISCSYCCAPHYNKLNSKPFSAPILPLVRDLFEQGLVKPATVISVTSGEPMLWEELTAFLDLVIGEYHHQVTISSNMTIREPKLDRWFEAGKLNIITSIDSGTRATFRKIKRRDLFDTVIANLRHVAKINPDSIRLNYVVLPANINDQDMHGLLDHMLDLGLHKISPSIDHYTAPSPDALDFLGRMKHRAVYLGFNVHMNYPRHDAQHPEIPVRKSIEASYRRQLSAYAGVHAEAIDAVGWGLLEDVKWAKDKGLWVSGWAYDKRNERCADEVAILWRDTPLFAGKCRTINPIVRSDVKTGFGFHSGDIELSRAVLDAKDEIQLYARFGNTWYAAKPIPPEGFDY